MCVASCVYVVLRGPLPGLIDTLDELLEVAVLAQHVPSLPSVISFSYGERRACTSVHGVFPPRPHNHLCLRVPLVCLGSMGIGA